MAYIYMFSFLCSSKLDAERIRHFLATDQPSVTTVGRQSCLLSVESHANLTGDPQQNPNEFWVSIVPWGSLGAKWPSGGPQNEQDTQEMNSFSQEIISEIGSWSSRLKFDYASPGVEVAGFRNRAEIIELLEKPDISLPDTIISYEIWQAANCPNQYRALGKHRLIFQEPE